MSLPLHHLAADFRKSRDFGVKRTSVRSSGGKSLQSSSQHKERVYPFKTASAFRDQHRRKYRRSVASPEQGGFYLKTQYSTQRSSRNEILDQTHVRNGISVGTGIPVCCFWLCGIGENVGNKCKDFKESLIFHFPLLSFNWIYAGVVELVDSLDLGSNAWACRFESCRPHHTTKLRILSCLEKDSELLFC